MIQQLKLVREVGWGKAEFLACNVDWPKKLKVGQTLTLKAYPKKLWTIAEVYSIPVDHTIEKTWKNNI